MIWLTTRLKLWAAAVLALMATLAGLYAKGRSDARAKDAAKDATQTIRQHEVRNEVDDDARRGNARERLRADWRE